MSPLCYCDHKEDGCLSKKICWLSVCVCTSATSGHRVIVKTTKTNTKKKLISMKYLYVPVFIITTLDSLFVYFI